MVSLSIYVIAYGKISNVNHPNQSTSPEFKHKAEVDKLNFYYGGTVHAIKNVKMPVQ